MRSDVSRACAWMECSRPRPRKVASIDEPPKLKSGAVTPVIGAMPTFIPTLTKSWNSSITVKPPAISAP